ncbi:hypothetical protein G6O69_01580 [Pseudenhygromyxa sp. WMMC2535]|nr:hypothetical protein [Pseudenhygromyxa sp. WMMC2535]NVB36504.1 hypothetical protein [Pseudenhygromyxa sp. WMMC2535]
MASSLPPRRGELDEVGDPWVLRWSSGARPASTWRDEPGLASLEKPLNAL